MALIPTKTAAGSIQPASPSTMPPTAIKPIPLSTAGFPPPATPGKISKTGSIAKLADATAEPPWLANGLVWQFPQAYILGFVDLPSAKQYLISTLGMDTGSLLWWGYCPAYLTPQFTITDIFTALVRAYGEPTLYVWISRNALPYANYIISANFGLQPTGRAGPMIPASQLGSYAVDSSSGARRVALQYVQYVPDVTVTAGNPAWPV